MHWTTAVAATEVLLINLTGNINMDSYKDFAYLYDMLTQDVEYEKRADYIENLMSLHMPHKPELVADIGCGTGTLCNIFSQRGYDMIGIDSSDSMLNVARGKTEDSSILYINQDMTEFELYGTVDVILSLLDSVNYLTEDGDIEKFFALANNYLNPDGLLIFDINTPYKFENILADNVYNYEDDKIFYSWENCFDGEICEFYLNFFVEDADGRYTRITEQHFERCYTVDDIKDALTTSGMELLAIYGDLSLQMPKNDEQRIFFVAKKH